MKAANDKNDKIENILAEALELSERGKTTPEILNLFPLRKTELEEFFRTADVVKNSARDVVPSEEFARDLIFRLSPDIAEKQEFIFEEDKKAIFDWRRFFPPKFAVPLVSFALSVFIISTIYVGTDVYFKNIAAREAKREAERELDDLNSRLNSFAENLDDFILAENELAEYDEALAQF